MMPPIKSVLSCLVILATASDIHTKDIRELEQAKELVVVQNKNIVFGEGVEPGQVPIIAYSLNKREFDMSVYMESKVCNFPRESTIGTLAKFRAIKQLTGNILIVLRALYDTGAVRTSVFLIYMDSCVSKVVIDQSCPLHSQNGFAIVPFADGYELITSKNDRVSFDADGFPHGDPEFFPIYSNDFFISTVSKRTPDKGYFIIDYTHQVVKFHKPDQSKKGEWTKKQWLHLKDAQILSNSEQSLYSVCGYNPQIRTTITCYQFDELGNEMWIHSAQPEFDTVLDVKSLAGGGLVFAAFKSKGNTLIFVKIGNKLEDVNIWSYSGKQAIVGARFKEYSEKDHTFVLVYETSQVMKGIFQKSVVSQKFSLQN